MNHYGDEQEVKGLVGLYRKIKNGFKLKKLFLKGKVRVWLNNRKKYRRKKRSRRNQYVKKNNGLFGFRHKVLE